MMFSFRQEQQNGFIDLHMAYCTLNTNDQLLANDIGDKVLLCWVYVIRDPQNTNALKEGENDLSNGTLYTLGHDIGIQRRLKLLQAQIHHVVNQVVNDTFLLSLSLR